jgi:hypothetical protein
MCPVLTRIQLFIYSYDSIFRQTQFSGGNVLNSRAPALLNSLKTKMGAI